MKSTELLRGTSSLIMPGAIVCLLMLSACGSRAVEQVDNKGANANSAADNTGSSSATNRTVPTASTTPNDKAIQSGTPQNADSARVSSVPPPQISAQGSDFFLFTQARAAIGADAELKTSNIAIDVKAGVVTLSGTVASETQKSKAEKLLREVSGVKDVKNRLRISS